MDGWLGVVIMIALGVGFATVMIGLSVLLLIAAFRSLWIPLVSAVFNLLSISAAYGVVTAVFQDGVGASSKPRLSTQ